MADSIENTRSEVLDSGKGSAEAQLLSLRTGITTTDLKIIELLGKRRRLVHQVGEVKREHNLAVRDKEREKSLLEILVTSAEKEGLSKDYVLSLYDIIIHQSVSEEEELMNMKQS